MRRNLFRNAILSFVLLAGALSLTASPYTIELVSVNSGAYSNGYYLGVYDMTLPWGTQSWSQVGVVSDSGGWCTIPGCTFASPTGPYSTGTYSISFEPQAGHVYDVDAYGGIMGTSTLTERVMRDGQVLWEVSRYGNINPPLNYRILGDGTDVQLQLGPTTTDLQRRVLLSNGGYTAQQQPYFSSAQVEDGKLKIRGWAKFGTPAATPVYFKLEDPPGTAPYQVGSNGDNSPLPGILATSTALVQSDGSFETTLQVTKLGGTGTGHAASGDNYRVVASLDGRLQTDPTFVCTASDCGQTGVITVWKRMFVELDRMFKKGTYIKDTSTGLMLSVVNSSGFTKDSQVAVLHAPQLDGLDPAKDKVSWETATVKARGAGFIELYPPGVSGTYNRTRTSSEPWRADAVGLLTGTLATEAFDANVSLLPKFFDEAFVEIKILETSGNPTPYVPYEELTYASDRAKTISDRWFETAAADNHIHLISANRDDTVGDRPMGVTRDNADFTYVFETRINDMVNGPNRRSLLNGEVVTHELIHQWEANGGTAGDGDHCANERTYDPTDGALFCIMRSSFQSSVYPYPMLPEFYDGKVMGHFKTLPGGAVDSEYMSIRKHKDPAF